MMAQAAKTSRIVQRSRTRGAKAQPSHAATPARTTEEKKLLWGDRGRPGPAGGGKIARRRQVERATDGRLAWCEPASFEPRRRRSALLPHSIIGGAEIVPLRGDGRLVVTLRANPSAAARSDPDS